MWTQNPLAATMNRTPRKCKNFTRQFYSNNHMQITKIRVIWQQFKTMMSL